MPEFTATRSVDRSLADIWEFVREMDNWAPMITGYVAHVKESDKDSLWTLTGDLGPFSKSVKMRVHITDWKDAERIAFELEGIDEVVSGHGSFDLSEDAPPPPPPQPWWRRFMNWLLGKRPALTISESAKSHVIFTFAVEVGGPMAPMVNAMIGPAAEAVATDLLAKVGERLDG